MVRAQVQNAYLTSNVVWFCRRVSTKRTKDGGSRTQHVGHRMDDTGCKNCQEDSSEWKTQDPGQWTGLWTEDRGLMTEQGQNIGDG